MHFDRRVDARLRKALVEGGFAHSLVQYAQQGGRWSLDLQFRADPKSPNHRATLYSGLTIALDLQYNTTRDMFKLVAPKTWQNETRKFDTAWSAWQTYASLESSWPDVEVYLEDALPIIDASGRYTRREGAVQASLSSFLRRDFHVVDRESVIGFPDTPTQQKAFRALEEPVLRALQAINGEKWWTPPARLGDECDALAVTPDGKLLVIEIKPGDSLKGITWAPAQVQHYANLFQAWINEPNPGSPSPKDVLAGMVEQRVEVGLLPSTARVTFTDLIEVVPVVAVGPGAKPIAWNRLREVAERIEAMGKSGSAIQLWDVNTVGRVQVHKLHSAR